MSRKLRRSLAPLLAAAVLAAGGGRGAVAGGTPAGGAHPSNEAGVALFGAGRFEEAAALFREAIDADPTAPEPPRNLAAALASLAQRDLLAGRLDAARPRIDEAIRLHPDAAELHELLAALLFARGALYDARRAADRALDLDPESAAALELLGDLEYREGFLDAARRRWERARETAGTRTPALDAKLRRLQSEADADRSYGRSVSPHFTAQFEGSVPPPVAREVLRSLERDHARLSREFLRSPRSDIPVILSSRVLFATVTGSPPWAGGAFDGKIRIPVGGLETADDARRLAPVLAHELTHAFVRANVTAPLPLWFEEGLAEHFGGADPAASRRVLRASGASFPTLAALDAALRGGGRVDSAYAAAHLAITELVRRGGSGAPRMIVELAGSGTPFAAAFRGASGLELAELESGLARLR